MAKKIYAILIVFWIILIFSFSNQVATTSTKVSKGFSRTLIVVSSKMVGISIPDKTVSKIEESIFVPIRKCAHFFLYFILGVLFILFFYEFKISLKKQFLFALIACFLYAITDEMHQLFVPGRAGQLKDVFIDTLGAFTGILILVFVNRKRHDKHVTIPSIKNSTK